MGVVSPVKSPQRQSSSQCPSFTARTVAVFLFPASHSPTTCSVTPPPTIGNWKTPPFENSTTRKRYRVAWGSYNLARILTWAPRGVSPPFHDSIPPPHQASMFVCGDTFQILPICLLDTDNPSTYTGSQSPSTYRIPTAHARPSATLIALPRATSTRAGVRPISSCFLNWLFDAATAFKGANPRRHHGHRLRQP